MDPKAKTADAPSSDGYDDAFEQALKGDDAGTGDAEDQTDDHDDGDSGDHGDDAGDTGHDADADGDAGGAGDHDDAGGDDDPGDDDADGGEGDAPAADAKDDAATLTNEQLLERMSQLLSGSSNDNKPPPKAQKAEPEDNTGDARGEEDEPPPLYTDEERQVLESYRNDWPDIARAEALQRRAEYQQLVNFVFQKVQEVVNPLSETVDTIATRTHLQDLQSTVTDYDDVRDKVIAWVESQPAYLRAAYEHVITQGTVEEVADLVERYRKENGVAPKSTTDTAATQQQQPQDTELPAATKKAAAGLAPVRSKRSAPSGDADPADFDAAFAAFAKKV